MPFTPNHAVVALPFVRTPLVPAAIAVGAMAPDLPLFLRGLPLQYGRTHDLAWLPLTIVVALALLLVWRCVLRPATRELAPRWLSRRLPAAWDDGARAALRETFAGRDGRASVGSVLLLVASLAIGVVSHIVWDLFTHEDRWGSEVLPVLDEAWGPMTGYKWLQHGSSIVGLAIIGIWMLVWLARRSAAPAPPRTLPDAVRWAWWFSLPAILVIAWFAFIPVYGGFDEHFGPVHLAYRVLPPACAVWGVLTVGLCVVVQTVRASRGRSGAASDRDAPGHDSASHQGDTPGMRP